MNYTFTQIGVVVIITCDFDHFACSYLTCGF